MTAKTASILSVILTVLLLVMFAVLTLLFELIALNGASERQGVMAVSVSLLCQGAGAIVLGMLAWKSTNLMLTTFNWHPVLAVVIAVLLGGLVGGLVSFLSIVISIPLAGVR